ncbi:hypothetical protein [Euzebya rosea]|uniref:hypothetical protein n=1 Tax=Euzebya rosea TaxID=2052804 RepID=UPI0013001C42|nr:hypothetical protein [Euzebya rosea]
MHRGDTVYLTVVTWLTTRLADVREEEGFSTAELLGNAALALAVIVAIWGGLSDMGAQFIDRMRAALGM